MTDFLDLAPTLPDYATQDADAIIAGRRPSFGEFMGANVGEGWWGTTLGATQAVVRAGDGARNDPTPLPRHEWEASSYWRRGVAWDERMTVGRAQAMADTFDENEYRQRLIAARDPNVFEWAMGFGAQMGGAVADPVNFLPIAGPAARGLRFAEAGLSGVSVASHAARGAAMALERPGMLGGIARGATEGVVGNAVAAPYIYSVQEQFGDHVTWSRVVADLAIGGLIGGAFGGLGGALEGRGRAIEPDPIIATRILDSVSRDVAAGRPIEMPAGLARAITEDALIRSAPPEVSPFLRAEAGEGGAVTYHAELPTRPDGAPLTREEFEAELRSRVDAAVAEARMPATDPEIGLGPRDGAAAEVGLGPRAAQRDTAAPHGAAPDRMDAAYAWYREAIDLREAQARLAMPPPPTPTEMGLGPRPGAETGEVGLGPRTQSAQHVTEPKAPTAPRPGEPAPKAEPDPALDAATREIEAMRADGRFSAGDEALLKAGNDAADEMDALSRGLLEAGACTLRNLA